MEEHYCRVCGLFIETPPWGQNGDSPTYEICPCCGVEFGNEDYIISSVKKYRDNWLTNGAKWFEIGEKPEIWDLQEQLKNISESK